MRTAPTSRSTILVTRDHRAAIQAFAKAAVVRLNIAIGLFTPLTPYIAKRRSSDFRRPRQPDAYADCRKMATAPKMTTGTNEGCRVITLRANRERRTVSQLVRLVCGTYFLPWRLRNLHTVLASSSQPAAGSWHQPDVL